MAAEETRRLPGFRGLEQVHRLLPAGLGPGTGPWAGSPRGKSREPAGGIPASRRCRNSASRFCTRFCPCSFLTGQYLLGNLRGEQTVRTFIEPPPGFGQGGVILAVLPQVVQDSEAVLECRRYTGPGVGYDEPDPAIEGGCDQRHPSALAHAVQAARHVRYRRVGSQQRRRSNGFFCAVSQGLSPPVAGESPQPGLSCVRTTAPHETSRSTAPPQP